MTNRTITVTDPSANTPVSVDVNPISNRVYVANFDSNNITVIDGTSDMVIATVGASGDPNRVVVNPVTNKIYAANEGYNNVTVVDGPTNTTTTVAVGSLPIAEALNPTTNKVYVANNNSGSVSVLTEQEVQNIPLTTTITPLANNQTSSRTPNFTFTAVSQYSPTAPPPEAVYFQVDTWQGPWLEASGSSPNFSGQPQTLSLGPHVLYAYAGDGQEAGINGDGTSGQLVIGTIAPYSFTVIQAATTSVLAANPHSSRSRKAGNNDCNGERCATGNGNYYRVG